MRWSADQKRVYRHPLVVRITHWAVALSTFVLIFTGFGQMPMYKRYMIDQLPGLAWSSNYAVTLHLHYLAAMVLVFAAFFHLVYHIIRRDWGLVPRRGDVGESVVIIKSMLGRCAAPPCHKFLAEQRLAYAYMVFSFTLIIVTGMIKVAKNLPGFQPADGLLNWATHLHNLGTFMLIFGIIGHLAAFLFRENWPLLPSIFTGWVCADYARHRHPLWVNRPAGEKECKSNPSGQKRMDSEMSI